MEITDKATKYRWCHELPDNNGKRTNYSFTDWDEATSADLANGKTKREHRIELGRPRYEFCFLRIPKNRKLPVLVGLYFNDNGEYFELHSYNKYVTKKQLNEWESEALNWLVSNGYVNLYDGGENG